MRTCASAVRPWKRFMAVGCSHGVYADRRALDAVLKFQKAFKPHVTIHLGDCFDTTAFRAGAKSGSDSAASVDVDLECGLDFLERLKPKVFMLGNHEDRLYRLAEDPSAVIARAARSVIEDIESVLKKMGTVTVRYAYKQAYRLGNFTLCHGTVFTENTARDHAELYGNCIFAHAHRAGVQFGRRIDNPCGICVGTLIDIPRVEYCKTRKSTLAWSGGVCYGEFCEDETQPLLYVHPQSEAEWHMPN